MQLWPATRAAVRSQVAAHWGPVGVVAFFDAYPRVRGHGPLFVGGAAVQVGI